MTEQEFKKQVAEILRTEIKYSGQIGDYVIHGAIDSIWKLHTEQKLNIASVVRPEVECAKEGELLPAEGPEKSVCDGCKKPVIGYTTFRGIQVCHHCCKPL